MSDSDKTAVLIQLGARGKVDNYLSINPEITLFKTKYIKHSNFAMESIPQTFDGILGPNSSIELTLDRKGDFISQTWLEVNNLSGNLYDMIDYISISIGDEVIDKHTGDYLKIFKNLKINSEKRKILDKISNSVTNTLIRIPLQFWFCRNPGNALPLASISTDPIKIHIKFNNLLPSTVSSKLWIDYIFVDTNERLQLLTKPRVYVIEQVQSVTELNRNSSERKITTYFNHPIKELLWQFNDNTIITDAVIRINKKDMFTPRDGYYFSTVQRYQYYSGSKQAGDRDIYCFSFCLNPEDIYSSGYFYATGNSLKILSVQTGMTDTTELSVYTTNYNILSVHDGIAELLYIK